MIKDHIKHFLSIELDAAQKRFRREERKDDCAVFTIGSKANQAASEIEVITKLLKKLDKRKS